MLKLPKVRAVFDRKKKASTITTGMVEIEITFNRTQRKTLSSGVELYANQWEDGLIVRHAESKKLNKQITELIKKYESIVHIPADTRSAFPVISVQSPVSIQCCWQS